MWCQFPICHHRIQADVTCRSGSLGWISANLETCPPLYQGQLVIVAKMVLSNPSTNQVIEHSRYLVKSHVLCELRLVSCSWRAPWIFPEHGGAPCTHSNTRQTRLREIGCRECVGEREQNKNLFLFSHYRFACQKPKIDLNARCARNMANAAALHSGTSGRRA